MLNGDSPNDRQPGTGRNYSWAISKETPFSEESQCAHGFYVQRESLNKYYYDHVHIVHYHHITVGLFDAVPMLFPSHSA